MSPPRALVVWRPNRPITTTGLDTDAPGAVTSGTQTEACPTEKTAPRDDTPNGGRMNPPRALITWRPNRPTTTTGLDTTTPGAVIEACSAEETAPVATPLAAAE